MKIIEQSHKLLEEGGDWEKKNKLKVPSLTRSTRVSSVSLPVISKRPPLFFSIRYLPSTAKKSCRTTNWCVMWCSPPWSRSNAPSSKRKWCTVRRSWPLFEKSPMSSSWWKATINANISTFSEPSNQWSKNWTTISTYNNIRSFSFFVWEWWFTSSSWKATRRWRSLRWPNNSVSPKPLSIRLLFQVGNQQSGGFQETELQNRYGIRPDLKRKIASKRDTISTLT